MSAVFQQEGFPRADTADALPKSAALIRSGFRAARSEGKRARDAAHSLNLSEGQAIAAHVGTHDFALKAVPLKGPWAPLLQALELCGPLMALTRNDSVVHEKIGVYQQISGAGHMGLALGPDIDLRLFFSRWHAGFAVSEAPGQPGQAPAQSLQFYDAHGVAVHKIFVRAESDRAAFDDIAAQFSDASLRVGFTLAPLPKLPRPDVELDAPGLAAAWQGMTDTHEFFGLISRFEVERQQSFRLMEGRFTERADPSIVSCLLREAAFDGTPIMVFVSSTGCIQIHSGPVSRIKPMTTPHARWINVLDATFNLHLREDLIAHAWIVRKPTSDGVVTSVEIFDADGALMAMFFGSRKPGVPEQQAWRDIVARLPRLAQIECLAQRLAHVDGRRQDGN